MTILKDIMEALNNMNINDLDRVIRDGSREQYYNFLLLTEYFKNQNKYQFIGDMRTEVKRVDLVVYGNQNIINIEAKNVNPNWFCQNMKQMQQKLTIKKKHIFEVQNDIKKHSIKNTQYLMLFWVLTIKDINKGARPHEDDKYDSLGCIKKLDNPPAISLDTCLKQIKEFKDAIRKILPSNASLHEIKINSDSEYYQYYALVAPFQKAEP